MFRNLEHLKPRGGDLVMSQGGPGFTQEAGTEIKGVVSIYSGVGPRGKGEEPEAQPGGEFQ